jgi:hypothetical protein
LAESPVADAEADLIAEQVAMDVTVPPVEAPIASEPEPRRLGLAGLFRRSDGDRADPAPETATAEASSETVEQTGVPIPDGTVAEVVPASAPAPAPRRGLRGLFGRGAEPDPITGPDAQMVTLGTLLPYGQIGRACNVPRRDLGQRVDQIIGYNIHDTIPNTTEPRTFYITGFADNCPRQFTGALVMVGDVGTHEIVRYASHNDGLAYSATDNAYEEIKSRFCRVPRGEPCGDRLEALGEITTFITVYNRFGGAQEWVEILIHDGRVVAMDHKG